MGDLRTEQEIVRANELGEAWGDFIRLGYIRDWDQPEAEVAFRAFAAGADAGRKAEQARLRKEILRLTQELRDSIQQISEGP